MIPQTLFPLLLLAALLAMGFVAQAVATVLWLIFSDDLDCTIENESETN